MSNSIGDSVVESGDTVTVPCPDPDCGEEYVVSIRGQVSGSLTEECAGCGKKIWVSEKSISPEAKFFNIYSGDGGGNNYMARYKRVDLEAGVWERIS